MTFFFGSQAFWLTSLLHIVILPQLGNEFRYGISPFDLGSMTSTVNSKHSLLGHTEYSISTPVLFRFSS